MRRYTLIASVLVNLLLSVQLYRQQRLIPAAEAAPDFLGKIIPTIRITEKSGAPSVIPDAGRPSLVYVFARGCSWCAKNMNNLEALGKQAGANYRLVPIATATPEQLVDYAERNELSVPLYSTTATTFQKLGTPTTLLVSRSGKVLKQWYGAYSGKTKADIEKTLGIVLPDAISIGGSSK